MDGSRKGAARRSWAGGVASGGGKYGSATCIVGDEGGRLSGGVGRYVDTVGARGVSVPGAGIASSS